jgi:hypothetical protein
MKAVITFYSREREKIALAAALGGIQEHASVRLRRLDSEAADARFDQEYIAPRDVDTDWADVILVASPDVPRLRDYLDALARHDIKPTVVRVDGDDVEAARLAARAALKSN